jgi:hypothetical protein
MQFQSPELKLDLKEPEDIGNLAERLDQSDCLQLADHIIELVKIDERSMAEWLGKANGYLDDIDKDANRSMTTSLEQTGSGEDSQVPSTSLMLSAVIQATARITGALLSEPDLVKASEPGGEPLAQWVCQQLRTVDPDWVTDTDPLILHMAVTGLGWRKRWFDEHTQQFRSTFLNVNEVIINDNAKSLERVPRITHKIQKYPYAIRRSIEMGHWIDYEPNFDDIDPEELQDFYETDMWLDMDGDDYEEPYTVTINIEDTPCVVKCMPRWTKKTVTDTKELLLFRPSRRYYAYKMIPDPKGTFFPRGFGWLLGKTEHTADRLLASIDDTAKLSSENGGIAAVGGIGLPDKIELKGNRLTTINTDGRPVNDVISFFPAKQVTPGMFQTLDKVMTLGDRLAGTLNLLENAPASMTATLAKGIIDNGAQVHSAVHRRLVGSITEEVRSFAEMADAMGQLPEGMHSRTPIEVTADPNMATELHRGATAQTYHDMLQMPMVFNPHEVGLRFAQTMRLPNPEKLIAPPPPEPEATPAEHMEMSLAMEKEKTNRMKANAQSALSLAQAVKALADASMAPGNIDLMRLQIAQLEKTMEQLANDASNVGSVGKGMAGPPPNAQPPNAPASPAGAGIGGAAIGPPGGPNPAGAGGGVSSAPSALVPPPGPANGNLAEGMQSLNGGGPSGPIPNP